MIPSAACPMIMLRADAVLLLQAYYRGNKCQIWTYVLDVGGEALAVAFWMVLISNPATAFVTMSVGSSALSLGMVGRLFFQVCRCWLHQFHLLAEYRSCPPKCGRRCSSPIVPEC